MNYYIDLEFLEGTQKEKFPISLFRKNTPPTIDLISIGIVSEDGREFYAISKDFNLEEAWNRGDWKHEIGEEPEKVYWIRENVLLPIWRELFFKSEMEFAMLSNGQTDEFYANLMDGTYDKYFTFKSLQCLISKHGKTNKQIAEEIISFVYPLEQWKELHKGSYIDRNSLCLGVGTFATIEELLQYSVPQIEKPKFFAYYADYDWVAFCWIFGKMIDLPNGFPQYCFDIKQLMDEKAEKLTSFELSKLSYPDVKHNVYSTYDEGILTCSKIDLLKTAKNYPKNENEHHALSDAKFDKALHEFLNQL